MPSSHLILCRPLLLLPPIPPSIRVFSNESTLRTRWPKYWSFSFSIIPSKEIPGLISFRMDWLDLLAVQVLNHKKKKPYYVCWWILTDSNQTFGEGNGNPLQCSCLENPRDGRAWWAAFMGSHRVGHDWSDLAVIKLFVIISQHKHIMLVFLPKTNTMLYVNYMPINFSSKTYWKD